MSGWTFGRRHQIVSMTIVLNLKYVIALSHIMRSSKSVFIGVATVVYDVYPQVS